MNRGNGGYKPLPDEYYLVMGATPRMLMPKLGAGKPVTLS